MVDCEAIRARDMPTFNVSYYAPEQRPYGAFIDLVIFWYNTVLLIMGLVLFTLAKYVIVPRASPYWRYLDVRYFVPIVMVHTGAIIALVCANLFLTVPFNTFPCWASMGMVFAPALLQIPSSIKLYSFYREYKLNKATAAASSLINEKQKRASLASIGDSEVISESLPFSTVVMGLVLPSRLRFMGNETETDPSASVAGENHTGGAENSKEQSKYLQMIKFTKRFSSGNGTLRVTMLSLIPTFIMFFALVGTSEFARSGCNTCPLGEEGELRYTLYVGTALPFLFCVTSLLLVRRAPDPLYVVFEMKIAYLAFGLPAVISLILSGYTFRGPEDFSFRMVYQMFLLLFCLAQSAAPALTVMFWYFRSVWTNKIAVSAENDQAGAHGRSKAEFEAVLRDPVLHQAFMDHLVAEHSVESLRFHDEIQKWARDFNDMGIRTAQVRARKIVTLFIGDDAVFPVNLPYSTIKALRLGVGLEDHTRKSRQLSFKQSSKRGNALFNAALATGQDIEEPKPMDRTFFEEADKQICELMRLDAFARFELTKRYKDLTNELLSRATIPSTPKQTRVLMARSSMEAIIPNIGRL